jgi:hypothetical protein
MSRPPSDQESDPAESDYSKCNPHRLRKLLIALPIAVVIAFAATLAVGPLKSGSSSSGGNATTASSTTASSTSTEGCTSGPVGSNVRVTIYGNGEAACSEWNKGAAKSTGDFWKTKPQGEELQGELVCSMSKGGSLVIEVRDTGEHLYGNRICASLTAKGWHEAEGPGAQVEREQAKQKSERGQTAAAEQSAQNEREAQKHHKEQAQLEKEEAAKRKQEAQEHQKERAQSEREAAAQKQQEAQEHQKEQREHEQEAEKQHQEVEKQQQENAREARRNEEETKQAQREAQHGE